MKLYTFFYLACFLLLQSHNNANFVTMKFIAENIIDTVIEEIGVSTGLGLEKFELLSEDQPALAAFITAESNDALTAPEQELLFFTASVIYTAVQEVAEEWKAITTDQIAELEEINWEQMHEVKAGNFRD